MTDLLAQVKECKRKLEEAEKQKIRLETKLSGYMEQLKELGYSSIKAAKEALEELEVDCNELENTLEEKVHEFETKYAELLEK